MYQAKYAHRNQKRRLRWKKPFVLAMSVVILLLGMVSGSVAYLVASEDPLKNVFIPGEVKIEIDQNDSSDLFKRKSELILKDDEQQRGQIYIDRLCNTPHIACQFCTPPVERHENSPFDLRISKYENKRQAYQCACRSAFMRL